MINDHRYLITAIINVFVLLNFTEIHTESLNILQMEGKTYQRKTCFYKVDQITINYTTKDKFLKEIFYFVPAECAKKQYRFFNLQNNRLL